ncbi:MAG TPA: tetratricopeptide repeat protein, partial [Pirellulaceae bacterium]|nr:tetratricopeptide repeat protein [Pirellulaceae bacterium]
VRKTSAKGIANSSENSTTGGATASPPRRRRPILLVVGLLVILVGGWPAWQRTAASYHLSQGQAAIEAFDFATAVTHLEKARKYQPQRPDVLYWLAVAQRRSGKVAEVDTTLTAAGKLGWPQEELNRQRLLLRAQVGRVSEVETQLQEMIARGIDDQSAVQIYEALAQGYWANHRIQDTLRVLDFWIQWRPDDIDPRLMRADVYSEFNDPVSAEKEYRAVLAAHPDHVLSHAMLGRLLLGSGHVDDAAGMFRYALEHGPVKADLQVGLAECEFRSSRADEADAILKKVDLEQLDPEPRAKALKLEADIARFKQDHVRAADCLERAVKIWPHDSGVLQALGQAYAALGKKEEAEQFLQRSKEITARAEQFYEAKRRIIKEPDNADLRFEIGSILAGQGLADDAAEWFRGAVRSDRFHQPSHEALADYYTKKGDAAMASRYRESAQAALDATFSRAWMLLSRGEAAQAEQLGKLIANYSQASTRWQLLEAGLLARSSKRDEARAKLAPLLKDEQLRPLALTIEAELLVQEGKPLHAEVILAEAIKPGTNVNAHRWLGVIYYDLGASTNAELHLKRVAELDPGDYRAPRLLGVMNKDFEGFAEAIEDFQAALMCNPPKIVREDILLELADCFLKQRAYQQAEQVLNDAAISSARNALMAEVLYNTNRRAEAVKLLDEVLTQIPDHFPALQLRGDAALLAGENETAVKVLEHAIKLQPYDAPTRFKLSQAYARTGKAAESKRELARSDELKVQRQRFSKLHEQAMANPYDPKLRKELADAAKALGRDDLADVWNKALVALENAPKPLDIKP